MTTIKQKALLFQEKIEILRIFHEKSQTKIQTKVTAELQFPVSTLRTNLKNKEENEGKFKLGGNVQRKKQKKAGFRNDGVDAVLEEEEEPVMLQGFPGYSSMMTMEHSTKFKQLKILLRM
ncbi:hypothetical protein HHI36_006793 [Cryptolaemus montrouzieri]|uniref:HTH psq-type domain-containing protein n=1 Tax=Cryptolaemus montrouzieri TaxID=559131 RepID=A0ABD2NY50_9CUCU